MRRIQYFDSVREHLWPSTLIVIHVCGRTAWDHKLAIGTLSTYSDWTEVNPAP